jgi:hypothetical protein
MLNSKNILIIRSVSFQQLDKNLNAVVKHFPGDEYCFHLLTHSHGVERAQTYEALSGIIDYNSRRNFSFFHVPDFQRTERQKTEDNHGENENGKNENGKNENRINKNRRYEAVVVPVSNMTGVGFLNVIAMTLRIPAESVYICNMNSEMLRISKTRIFFKVIGASFFSLISGLLTVPLLILGLPVLLISLAGKGKGKS